MSTFSINKNRPELWKADVSVSVRMYNEWFLCAAPAAYRQSRVGVMAEVEALLSATDYLRDLTPASLRNNPAILATLRMVTAPPLARDRLVGLASVNKSLVKSMEEGKLTKRLDNEEVDASLHRIIDVVSQLIDTTLFEWLSTGNTPTEQQIEVASVVVGDRRSGALSDPIVRNAQEERQISAISRWLENRGYKRLKHPSGITPLQMQPGTYAIHQNIPVRNDRGKEIGMPVDIVVQPHGVSLPQMPILIEAKSAGDFTNTNKRRKEEATKARQLRGSYGENIDFLLLLCGYFDAGYLGYEAAEGIDWIWEHRIGDLEIAGI